MRPQPFQLPGDWPRPYDAAAADRLVERFRDLGPAQAGLADKPHVLSMLRCLGGNSPYLADLAIRESAAVLRLDAQSPDDIAADVLLHLRHIPPGTDRAAVAAALRRAKRVTALVTGIADTGGIWPLERVTGALSDLAETALRAAIRHLFRVAHDSGKLRLPDPDDPETGCGFTALAMGKLGARELNYSSDIDVILIYDRHAPAYRGRMEPDAVGPFTARLARDLVGLMQDRDVDGYVFRTDLRLRPDPAATPPAVSLESALTYYESLALNWERAAMIKVRPVAGDLDLGARFLDAIRPFVWRRGLDFAAVADIHAMKRRIDANKRPSASGSRDPVREIAERDVKLGPGGIREIEFLTQTLQLVWGGRDPTLRVVATFPALDALVASGHLTAAARDDLKTAYTFLRRVEHVLQMINDRQTHAFPKAGPELDRVAAFLRFDSAADLAKAYLKQTGIVRRRYDAVFSRVPDPVGGRGIRPDLDFQQDDTAGETTLAALAAMGFKAPAKVVGTVRGWLAGHVRALRSNRARELMTTMIPAILTALGRQTDPDEAFRRFDRFVTALPSGVQPMSLFQHNPALLERIAVVLGGAPLLAEHMARYPSALEGLIAAEDSIAPLKLLQTRVAGTGPLEDAIQVIRRAVKERDFLLSVGTLEGRLDVDSAGRQRTDLADATQALLMPRVLADFASRFGSVDGGGMAVVAMGKAGGQEMMAGSDLDLMLIYDHKPGATESRGARALPASQWFVRATHAYIAALTAPGPEGQMYAVDMRLRPSGNKGPVAVSLAGFVRYHAEDAWTWERMALTRARVITGSAALRGRVEQAIAGALHRGGDAARIRADAAAMRARMIRDHPHHGPWDVKLRPGGLVDIEFIAQVLQLVHAPDHPGVFSPNTATALAKLRDAGLLDAQQAAVLIQAGRVWRTIQGMLRLTVGQVGPEGLPPTPSRLLLHAMAQAGLEAVEIPALLLKLDGVADRVRTIFNRQVGELGG
jgi:glutamate-ammonia-ligase adenylyltransferase